MTDSENIVAFARYFLATSLRLVKEIDYKENGILYRMPFSLFFVNFLHAPCLLNLHCDIWWYDIVVVEFHRH